MTTQLPDNTDRKASRLAAAFVSFVAFVAPCVFSGSAAADEGTVSNPYRHRASEIAASGRDLFNASCARCHGNDADIGRGTPAPDLRRVDAYCRQIVDPAVKAHCMADNDRYFFNSVRDGKVILGIRHMPAWGEVLTQEQIWTIQIFIESQAAKRNPQ